jgi:hypothetical protein
MTTEQNALDWMRGGLDAEQIAKRNVPALPFCGNRRDGTQATFWTDGRVLLWGEGQAEDAQRKPRLDAEFWEAEPTEWKRFRRADLLAWCAESPCKRCGGDGTVDHECDCVHCGADIPDVCPECEGRALGKIGDTYLDRKLLAPVLVRMDADVVRVAVSGFRTEIRGERRGALLMGVRISTDAPQVANLPALPAEAA